MESGACGENDLMEADTDYGDADSMDYGVKMEVEASNSSGEMEEVPLVLVAGQMAEHPSVQGCGNVEPFEGMEFDNEEDAWMFYNSYARQVGFNTRISVMHRSRRDGSITSRQFVCAKEGFRTYRGKTEGGDDVKARRTRAVTRVGCKAMIRVKKQENGKWAVSKLEKVHNHALLPLSQVHCLRPHKPLSECGKRAAGGLQKSRACNGNSEFAIREYPLEVNTVNPIQSSETQIIIEYIKRMQDEDPNFFYAPQFVGDQLMGNVFWADARSRTAYKHFGDVVIFDDFSKRHQSQVPLVTFTGVNHHGEPVLFGCALIVEDSESSLIWLFNTLLSAMSRRHPTSIISENDNTINTAVSRVLTQTRHRVCKWHILKEAEDKLFHVFEMYKSFHDEFINCIGMTSSTDEFEASWSSIMLKFDLTDNEWLRSIYTCRHQWVPVYLRSTFFGDIASNQCCESRSLFFDGYINVQTDPQSFIKQYEKALDSWYEKEVKDDFDTIYSLPNIKTALPLEKQAADLYTRKIFTKFQEELTEVSLHTAEKAEAEDRIHTYKVSKSVEKHETHIVKLDTSEMVATCSCRMFEYSGIVCRHILTIFSTLGASSLPLQYILNRWTKNAMNGDTAEKIKGPIKDELVDERENTSRECHQSLSWRYNNLCREAIKFAEEGAQSPEIYIVAINALHEAVRKVAVAKKNSRKSWHPSSIPNGMEPTEGKSLPNAQDTSSEDLMDAKHESSADEGMHFQQPLNFLLLAPGLSNELRSSNLLLVAAPLSSSTTPTGQAFCMVSGDQQAIQTMNNKTSPILLAVPRQLYTKDGNGPILLTTSLATVGHGEPESSELASQPPQVLNVLGIGQSNINLACDGKSANSASLLPLVALPVAACLPSEDNLRFWTHVETAVINSSSAATPDSALVLLHVPPPAPHWSSESNSQAAAPEFLAQPNNPSSPPLESTNAIRAAALAAGARIASPSDAASIMRVVQSRNAIHIRAGEKLCLFPAAVCRPPVNVVMDGPGECGGSPKSGENSEGGEELSGDDRVGEFAGGLGA